MCPEELRTVEDYIKRLEKFPRDWPVVIKTGAGGEIVVEHREIQGKPVVAVFNSNGGRFGENPLTQEEYERKSSEFLACVRSGKFKYTSIHGDHRLYVPTGLNDTCYGTHYDPRIIERMVSEGKIAADSVDIGRVARFSRLR